LLKQWLRLYARDQSLRRMNENTITRHGWKDELPTWCFYTVNTSMHPRA